MCICLCACVRVRVCARACVCACACVCVCAYVCAVRVLGMCINQSNEASDLKTVKESYML